MSAIASAQNEATGSVQVDWIRQYISGFDPAFDFAYAISVDKPGNVIVTGSSWGSNNLPDIVTIKYTGSGDTAWVRRYNGPDNNWDAGRALFVDAAGNIYITGETFSNSTDFDYITIKYNSAGEQQWMIMYDGPANSRDVATAIAVDSPGNVYVTGYSEGSPGSRSDYATIKYNISGEQQWVARYNGPGSQADFAFGLALDPLGNIYVTGTADDLSVTHFPAYATVKYSPSGVQMWASIYQELWTYARAITVDQAGNSYVTGRSYAQGTFYDYATVKYNTVGVQQWVARYNGPGTSDDEASSIAVDALGNVYVTGEAFFEPGAGSDYATVKYDAFGTEQWVARYNGPGSATDIANAIVLNDGGNVYITGGSRGTAGDDDFATIKYNSAGDEQWIIRYSSQGNDVFDIASAIAINETNNVYVTGRSSQTGGQLITTIKYTEVPVPVELVSFTANVNAGVVTLNWITASEINNLGFEIQRLQEHKITGLKNWEVVGFVDGNGTTTGTSAYSFNDEAEPGKYFYRLKQIDFDGTFEYSNEIEVEVRIPGSFVLYQNYPNPFNPGTVISYRLQLSGNVTLKVYDVLGNEIATLINEHKSPGTYKTEFNSSSHSGLSGIRQLPGGLYFYTLTVRPELGTGQGFSETKKMILLK